MSPLARAKELSHGGKTYAEIAKTLTKEGVAPPEGGDSWNRRLVEDLLAGDSTTAATGSVDPEASSVTDTPGSDAVEDATVVAEVTAPAIEVQRICRKCSAQVTTASLECPICGTSYMKPGVKRSHLALGGLLVLLLAGGIVGAVMYSAHQKDVRSQKAERAADKRAEQKATAKREAAKAEQEAEDAAAAAAAKVAADLQAERAAGAKDLAAAVNKDAKKKVASGLLDGPVLHSTCTPAAGGVDDSTATTESYDCFVATTKNSDGTESGYGYKGSVDYDTGSMTWQLGN